MVKIKVCGVRSVADVRACRDAGVDLVGLNFVATSRRKVSIDVAAELMGHLGTMQAVGLFQNEAVDNVADVIKELGLSWVQLHGSEEAREFRSIAKTAQILKAWPADEAMNPRLEPWRSLKAEFLFDGPKPGSGQAFQWDELSVPFPSFFIAGGLHAGNVADAIRRTGATGVDTASGVEVDGNIRAEQVFQFVQAARGEV